MKNTPEDRESALVGDMDAYKSEPDVDLPSADDSIRRARARHEARGRMRLGGVVALCMVVGALGVGLLLRPTHERDAGVSKGTVAPLVLVPEALDPLFPPRGFDDNVSATVGADAGGALKLTVVRRPHRANRATRTVVRPDCEGRPGCAEQWQRMSLAAVIGQAKSEVAEVVGAAENVRPARVEAVLRSPLVTVLVGWLNHRVRVRTSRLGPRTDEVRIPARFISEVANGSSRFIQSGDVKVVRAAEVATSGIHYFAARGRTRLGVAAINRWIANAQD